MTFQLRRMLLVNAGTNKHMPSGRITELDPRGGAAVVGGNAVGKTSTLRLIPLFFGHPVSQVVAMHQGQEGVRFILPTMTSAICFEYQRGSDRAEDVRLVVMRARADGSDAAEYRIYETAFLTELFVKDGRFLTDDGTEERAQSLGIKGTSKLATSDYRSVILRSGFHTKDHKRLYSYALAHSFGPRSLPNLDKLVATMVKNGVKFEELVQVAVGLIQDDLSGDAQRHTLKMRQQRKHIEAWLRNRDAAEEALKLQPRINELSGLCLDHRTLETEWRHRHADVDATIAARTQEGNDLQEQILEAGKQREATIASEKVAGDALAEAARKASETAGAAKHAFDTAQGQQTHYETQNAEHWSRELVRLEPLEHERRGLQQQVSAAELVAESATLEYTKRQSEVQQEASATRDRLEAGKKPHHDQYDVEVQAIGVAEAAAIDALDGEAVGKRESMAIEHGELLTKRGEWQARVDNPAVPAELEEAVTNASNQVIENGRKLNRETVQLSDAAKELHRTQNEFDACERTLERVLTLVKESELQLAHARAVLHPENGTLLSALRAHPEDQWKRDLARVLNPELLQRTDLNPHALPEGLGGSIYGWSLETRAIEAPGWTDDLVMRESVAHAEANLANARQTETAQREEHKRRSAALTAARERHTTLEAQTSVTTAQGKVLKDAMEQARERVRLARADAKRDAESQLQVVKAALAELNLQAKSLESRLTSDRSAIRREHEAQRQTALQRRNDAIANIDANIRQVNAAAAEQAKSLEKQLAAHLSEKGVDVKALEGLKTRVADLDERIAQLTLRKPMVEAWKTWMADVGPTKVAALQQEAARLAESARQASNVLEAHNRKCDEARRVHNEVVAKLRARAEEVSAEMDILMPLKDVFGSYLPQRHDGFDTTTKAVELRRLVRHEARQLEEHEAGIKRLYTELHRVLTSRESTVKQLVDASLAGHAGSDIAKANELLLAYRLLPTQVLSELNNTLQTVLGQIGHFRKSIVAFEDEVRRFNTQLQKALNEVERFDRVDQLRLDIVADFEGLGFYKKLKRMDDVVRQHQGDRVLDYLRDMPPAATAEALRDFMSVIGTDGTLEVNLASHITLHGSVVENGTLKSFKRASELENVSSTGLTTLILITLLVGLVNVVRRGESVHVPWVTDEVGRFDASNFAALLKMLADNRIDVITAAPQLGMAEQAHFANRYLFADRGEIRRYAEPSPSRLATLGPVTHAAAEGVQA